MVQFRDEKMDARLWSAVDFMPAPVLSVTLAAILLQTQAPERVFPLEAMRA